MTQKRANVKASNLDGYGIATLVWYFVFWKILLLVVACTSPGPGYDTSTQILFEQYQQPTTTILGRMIEHVVLRLTRWDGIYFASNAAQGHFNEQNWAFSWALARFTSFSSGVFLWPLALSSIIKDALAGILISNTSHLVAVIALYQLTYNLIASADDRKRRIAFVAACLHTISPAGLFLSAPFGESTFAMLSFLGARDHVNAKKTANTNVALASLQTVRAGLYFGAATTVRSNGILNGIIFAWDALNLAFQPTRPAHKAHELTLFMATIVGGILVGAGFAVPQIVAYVEYCTGGNTRPWCSYTVPSIYRWVQDYYWEVGFLRYWTPSNLPLFIIAGPMLAIMLYTGYIGFFHSIAALSSPRRMRSLDFDSKIYTHVMPRLALPQLILTVMAATSFHVQIVNRISSGYPVWYIVLASAMCTPSRTEHRSGTKLEISPSLQRGYLKWIVKGMVMYAIVQGGLYASFLPPA